jgi:acetylornithine deacetylase
LVALGGAGRPDVVGDLARLVAFPTVSSRPNAALCAWLAERCEALGFVVERFEDPEQAGKATLICRAGPEGEDGLVLSGHLDVVPTEGQPWRSDPFALRAAAGRLYGRGTADMKGFVAATLAALAELPLAALRRQLVLVWTHDEEVGCRGSALLAEALRRREARLPSACWIGEPTGMRLLRQHAGHVAVGVRCRGQAAHSAYPALGANAVLAAAKLAVAAAAAGPDLRAAALLAGAAAGRADVALNVASLRGGEAINIIPDDAELRLGLRPPPGCPEAPLLAALERALAAVALPTGTRYQAEVLRRTPSLRTPPGGALERWLAPALPTAPGGDDDDVAPFATDGGNLATLGCAPLICGPGRIEVAHQADEYVEEAELRAAVPLIAGVVARATGLATP